jgi:hypothetical protein
MKEYTKETALRKVLRNAQAKERNGIYYVLQGTAGNGTLGAISYLTHKSPIGISVVSENQYKRL